MERIGKEPVNSTSLPGSRSAAEEALHRLVTLPEARYEELLAVPAEHALRALGAHTLSLSRWERDRGLLRTLVTVGDLRPGASRFPRDEAYGFGEDEAVARVVSGRPALYLADGEVLRSDDDTVAPVSDSRSGVSVPVYVDGRLWGELWARWRDREVGTRTLDEGAAVAVELAGMVAVAERLQRMGRMAFQDPLTGLGNRRALDDALAEMLAADGPGATIVMCDVDDLKAINDERGHVAGDRAIVAVADALAGAATEIPGSVVVRLGGDEFAVLFRGAARGRAIEAVEAAARRLGASGQRLGISCGLAVVAAGVVPRDALAAVDHAQYAAKTRGALLVVAADVTGVSGALVPDPVVRERNPGRRRVDRPRPAGSVHAAAAQVVTSIARGMADVPPSTHSRLGWLAERLLVPFDLEHWALSRVDLAGPRLLRVSLMAVRQARVETDDQYPLLADTTFRLDDYPLSRLAVESQGWFAVSLDDDSRYDSGDGGDGSHDGSSDGSSDEAEREVLRETGSRTLVALGCHDGATGWLLEVYGGSPGLDAELLGSVLSLGASALLGRLLPEVQTLPT